MAVLNQLQNVGFYSLEFRRIKSDILETYKILRDMTGEMLRFSACERTSNEVT